MTSPIVGYAEPNGEPVVRGVLVLDLAIIVRVPRCPICGRDHRFPYLPWAPPHNKIWLLTCPVAVPEQQFIVRVMSTSLQAIEREAELALQTLTAADARWKELGRTWVLGMTWVPAMFEPGSRLPTIVPNPQLDCEPAEQEN
jgi:hypothetical protein